MTHKVLHVIASLGMGGAQSVLLYLLDHLRSQKRYSFAISTVLSGGMFESKMQEIDVPVYPLNAGFRYNLWAAQRLRRVIREVSPDIIHCHLGWANLYSVLANSGAGRRPLLYTEHSIWNRRRASKLFQPYGRLLSKGYDRVVAVSEVGRVRFVEWTGTDLEKTVVIPNGLNVGPFATLADEKVASWATSSQRTEFTMICVARLAPPKGLDVLLEAAQILLAGDQRFRLLIVGDGPLRQKLEVQRSELRLDDCVEFLGSRSDVPDLLAGSDLFVLPSLWEALPLALLEAMASGLPAVATAVGAVPEAVRNGQEGYLVPPNEAGALAEALAQVMALSGAERSAMGQRARDRVAKKYSVAATGRQLLDVYDSLLKEVKR